MGPLEKRARELATAAHAGQTDKAELPYILHPQRVAERLATDEEKAVAWLHDVIEDTEIRISELWAFFPEEVVHAVAAITRKHDFEGDDYYRRVAENRLATVVKRADIADNLDPNRLARLTGETRKRLVKKYTHALTLLPV